MLHSAATSLVGCFLFQGAAPLPAPIAGTTPFAVEFAAEGPTDAQGRSLRTLDVETRLFRHPCSLLIHSQAFAALPGELRQRFWTGMDAALRGPDAGGRYAHLTPAGRSAIREILLSTVPDTPRHWDRP